MSYTSNYNLNIRLSALEAKVAGGGVPTSSDLADVLLNGNSAGVTDIDLNFNDILNCDNLQTNTINGSAVPSGLPNTLQEVLTANNITDLTAEFRNNLSTPTYINTISSTGMSSNNDLGINSSVDINLTAPNGSISATSNTDLNIESTNGDINLDTPSGVVNINGVPYPPVVPADTLSAVLTAGNTAVNTITLQDATTPLTLFSQMGDTGFLATDATGSPQYDASVSANNVSIITSNGESNTLTAGSSYLVSGVGQNLISITGMNVDNLSSATDYSTAGINAGNLSSSIDYQITSNMASNNGYARLDLKSGDLTTTPPRAVLQAYADYTAVPAYGLSVNKIDLGTATGDDIVIQNGEASPNDLPENTITLHQDGSYSNNYIKLRSAFDFVGLSSFLTLGIDTFALSIANQSAITIGSGSTDPVEFRRNISTTTNTASSNPVGMLENSVINATTTGTTTLTISNAFATIVNTPTTTTRIFVLPAPTVGTVGFWYAICNKSTSFTIAVQYPASTTIATIPVATNATNGGSVARFAVTAGGASYFAVSEITNSTNATNVGITSDNTAGTYYIPFAKTSGTGNKPLFIDDVTTPFSYNPSTGTTSATAYTITGTPATASVASTFGQVGLVKITAVQVAITGSAVAQNLSFASLFNSTYKNYRIILHPTTQVSFTQYPAYSLQAFLGTGVPTVASLYGFEMISTATTVVSPVYTAGATISSAPLIFAVSSNTNKEIIFDIQNVGYATTATQLVQLSCKSLYGNPGVNGASDRTISASALTGATITGLTIQQTSIGASNNFTLEAVVYGYNNL